MFLLFHLVIFGLLFLKLVASEFISESVVNVFGHNCSIDCCFQYLTFPVHCTYVIHPYDQDKKYVTKYRLCQTKYI